MASLSNHVTLTITRDSVGVARANFGIPLILSATATFSERVRTYASLAEVAVDFASTTGPEYLAAQAMFSQSPHPKQVKIGRSALPPTLVHTLSVTTVRNLHTYKIVVKGDGVTTTTASYTSDASATDGEIATGLVAALNAVAGNNYIAAGTASPFTVTADAAGEWFSLEIVDNTDISTAITHADPGVATDLTAIELYDSDWYGLCTLYNSNAYVLAAAAWIEASTNYKVYLADCCDTIVVTATGGSDTFDDLETAAYSRTMGCYHPSSADMFAAAWLGDGLPRDPGSATWKFKTLTGPAAVVLTSTQRGNLRGKFGNSIETVAGVKITYEGQCSDGGYLDDIRGLDWLVDDMSKAIFEGLASAPKIPFTNKGIATISALMRGSLKRAVNKGILTDDPSPVVTVPLVADISSADKASRTLPDMKFSGTLAGAVHNIEVTGVISL